MNRPEYSPLNPAKREIRVLKIEPGADDGQNQNELRCSMSTLSLDETTHFMALSYVWGDPTIREDIIVDDRPVSVTRNLACALRAVRDLMPWKTFPYWADAICINQEDDTEKMHQIGLMGDIYKMASMVIAWVGEESENSDRAVDALLKISALFERHYRTNTPRQLVLWLLHLSLSKVGNKHELPGVLVKWRRYWLQGWQRHMASPVPDLFAGTTVDDDQMPNWSAETRQAVFDFINRPYWYRVWTFQELVLAKNINIICGSKLVPWTMLHHIDRFAGAWYALDYDTKKENMPALLVADSIATAIRRLRPIFSLMEYKALGRRFNLVEATEHVLNRDATHPLDRVYGCLGLVPHAGIKADYSISEQELYRHVMLMRFAEVGMLGEKDTGGEGDYYKKKRGYVGIDTVKDNFEQSRFKKTRIYPVPLFLAGVARQKLPDLPSWVHDLSGGSPPEKPPPFCQATKDTIQRWSEASVKGNSLFIRAKEVGQIRRGFITERSTLNKNLRVIIAQWFHDSESSFTKDDRVFDMARDVLSIGYGDAHGRHRKRRIEPGSAEEDASIRSFLEYVTLLFKPYALHPKGQLVLEQIQARLDRLPERSQDVPERYVPQGPSGYLRLDVARSSLAYTEEGGFVSSDPAVRLGDRLFLAPGHNCPLVLRRSGEHYIFVSWAYASGMMAGELLEGGPVEWCRNLDTIEIR